MKWIEGTLYQSLTLYFQLVLKNEGITVGPSNIVNGKRLVTHYKRRQSGINALVEKNPHAAS